MRELATRIDEAVAAIRAQWDGAPRVGVILGTGLGGLAGQIDAEAVFDYADIPHFPVATALGHRGRLLCGRLAGVPIAAMEGRFHVYEGHSLAQITFPVRLMKSLGIQLLIVTNAAGGLNPLFASGDIMFLDDHINLLGGNPLVGINDDRLGPRFPDMSRPYDPPLIERGLTLARHAGIVAHRGVYAAMCGPNFETRAEYRFLRTIGADAVGMSTVPEVIVAVHGGLRVMAMSVVTNVFRPGAVSKTDGESVVAAARSAEPKLSAIVRSIVAEEFCARALRSCK